MVTSSLIATATGSTGLLQDYFAQTRVLGSRLLTVVCFKVRAPPVPVSDDASVARSEGWPF